MLLFKRYFAFFLFLLCVFRVGAQQTVVRTYSPKDGLPSTESYAVLTDHAGFIWITTDAGLSRFNGYSFKNFSIREGLPESTVFKLYEDRKNRMWFTTLNSNLGYVYRDSVFMLPALTKDLTITKGISAVAFISSIYVDENDTLWLGTYQNGRLIRIAPPYNTSKPVVVLRDQNFILQFSDDPQKHCIYGYGSSGKENEKTNLLEIYRSHGKETRKQISIDVPDNTSAKSYIYYKNEGLFITSGSNVFLEDKAGLHGFFKTKDQIIYVSVDANGYLWVAGSAQGIYCFPDPMHSTHCKHYFGGANITGVALDFEGSYWFTSLERGLFYMPRTDFVKIGPEEGFAQKRINSVALINKDTIAAQSYSGDLYLLAGKSVKVVSNTGNNVFVTPSFPGKLFYTGRFPGYVSIKDAHIHLFSEENKMPWYINHYTTDKNGNLFGSHTYYILRIKKDLTISSILTTKGRINTFLIDRQGVFWIGTTSGLMSWDSIQGIKYWSEQNPMLARRTDAIAEDDNGRLWLATRGAGLFIFDKKNSVINIDERKGLPSDFCRTLLIDSLHRVWVGTNAGLCKVDEYNLSVTNYGFLNELTSGEINNIVESDNKLLIATSEGVFSYSIEQLNSLSQNPPVFITGVATQYRKGIEDHITLPYLENHVRISFLGLSYFESGKMDYSFKLEGVDPEWRHSRELFAEYSNLQPGDYRFIVKPSVGPVYGINCAIFHFRINPPFWKTFWFISLISLSTVLSVIFFFRFSIARVRKKEQEKTKIRETIAGLEATALRAQMNPHFIFNAINSIQNFILRNEKKTAHDFLIKFSRLIRNVLEFSKSDFISIGDEVQTLDLYIQLEKLRASDRFSYLIEVDPEIPEHTLIPSMILQPFIENAILHGLFPKEDVGGMLRVIFSHRPHQVLCTIEDNGIGRAKAAEIKSKKQNYHRSVGLSVTAERLDLLRSENHFEASSKTEDLFDEKGNPAGTRITLLFGTRVAQPKGAYPQG